MISSNQPLVSVLLTSYNYAQYVGQAISSVFAQTYRPLELIIVDDGSTDNTRDIIESATEHAPIPVTKTFQENRGQAGALNAGFLKAGGEIVCLLDSDDYWQDSKVDQVVHAMRQYPGGAVYQHLLETGKGLKRAGMLSANLFPLWKSWDNGVFNLADDKSGMLMSPFVPTSGLSFPREILQKVMPIPETLYTCPDAFLTRTCVAFGPLISIPAILGVWRDHKENTGKTDQARFQEFWVPVVLPAINAFYQKNNLGLQLTFDPARASRVCASRMLGEVHRVTGFAPVSSIKKIYEGPGALPGQENAGAALRLANLLRLVFSERIVQRLSRFYRRAARRR